MHIKSETNIDELIFYKRIDEFIQVHDFEKKLI